MAKVCNSAFVDSRYGNDKYAELSNPDRKFKTICCAIAGIRCQQKLCGYGRWTVFLDPCTFEEDVKLYPAIDLHGKDRRNSVIKGNISASKLKAVTDQVEIKELSVVGQISKMSKSLGTLLMYDVIATINLPNSPFVIEAGSVQVTNCTIQQIIDGGNSNCYFYQLLGANPINLMVRNCLHTRTFAQATITGQVFSNIVTSNTNLQTIIAFQSNTFSNSFSQLFKGLLIPYYANSAAGFLQSHGDTLEHAFTQGAGTGVIPPTVGATYSTAFILLFKITAPNSTLEAHVHTTEVLHLPETTLNIFSSAHNVSSEKAKTKHVGWQSLREIPEALRILDNTTPITVTQRNAERSMIGAASDDKHFSGRLVVETLDVTAANYPPVPPDNPLGAVLVIPDNVGVVNVEENAVMYIPIPASPTIGQQITFNFLNGDFFGITAVADPTNPPSLPLVVVIRDSRGSPTTGNFIAYSLYDITPPKGLYPSPPYNIITVKNTVSVTFTLTNLTLVGGNLQVTLTAVSIPGTSQLLGPGSYTIPIPKNVSNVRIIFWAAGGSGGPFASLVEAFYYGSGGGGAGGATIFYTTTVTNLQSILMNVAPTTNSVGVAGNPTVAIFSYSTKIDNFTALGGNGGGIATYNDNSEQFVPAPGGTGNGATFTYNNQSVTPPPNFTVITGANGGNGGPPTLEGSSKGFDGQPNNFSGEPGGIGGTCIGPSHFGPIVSGSGGGSGGYQGPGGSGGNFTTYFGGQVIINGVAGPSAGLGGGGGGQGPADIPGVINGGAGGALVTFF